MARYTERERAIPLPKSELIRMLLNDPGCRTEEEERHFRQFCRLVEAILHFEFHHRLKQIKKLYAPYDPDAVAVGPAPSFQEPIGSKSSAWPSDLRTSPVNRENTSSLSSNPPYDSGRVNSVACLDRARPPPHAELLDQIRSLLERANFVRLDRSFLEQALQRPGRWGLNFQVHFELFETLEFFIRGDIIEKEKKPARLFGLIPEREVEVPVYERLVLIVRFHPDADVPPFVDKHCVYVKLFKDVPKDDLEMLVPGTDVRIRPLDGVKIGLPLLFGVLTCLWKLVMGAALTVATGILGMLTWLTIIGAPVSYGVRSYFGYVSTRQKYLLTVTQCLFFQNLDNNLGAITLLIDEAEEQEFREIVLSWFFLWRFAGESGWTADQLDDCIEQFGPPTSLMTVSNNTSPARRISGWILKLKTP